MLKKMTLKKISICIISVIAMFLLYVFPKNDKLKVTETIEYKNDNASTIFLLDNNNYLAMANININDKNKKIKARKLLTALIQNEEYEDYIPNGFKNIIPEGTKILNIECNNNTIKVDFNEKVIDTTKELEEKVIEAIVYTLTSIDDIKYVIIYINGDILTHLPQNNITIPATLDRSFGINKEYDINNDKNIDKTTIYYINKYNDNEYYVPVTKITNSTKKKADIIIEQLGNLQNNNLISYLNSNTKIVSMTENNDNIDINFNDYIYNDKERYEVMDEVINCIYLSIIDNYDVKEVILKSNNKEFYKKNTE